MGWPSGIKTVFPAWLGVNFLFWKSIVLTQGIAPERRKSFLPRPGSTVAPQNHAAGARDSTLAPQDRTVPASGIIPTAWKITVLPPGSTAAPPGHSVPARKNRPAPPGMHPAAHGEAILPPRAAHPYPFSLIPYPF